MNAHRMTTMRLRQAFSMSEMIIALAITSFAMVGIAQMMSLATRQYSTIDSRRLAFQEAANVMEDLMSRTWDDIAAIERLEIEPSDALRQAMPAAEILVKVDVDPEHAESRRITVQITLPGPSPNRSLPIQLVAWQYRNEELAP